MYDPTAIMAAAVRHATGQTGGQLPAELAELSEQERRAVVNAAARSIAATKMAAHSHHPQHRADGLTPPGARPCGLATRAAPRPLTKGGTAIMTTHTRRRHHRRRLRHALHRPPGRRALGTDPLAGVRQDQPGWRGRWACAQHVTTSTAIDPGRRAGRWLARRAAPAPRAPRRRPRPARRRPLPRRPKRRPTARRAPHRLRSALQAPDRRHPRRRPAQPVLARRLATRRRRADRLTL